MVKQLILMADTDNFIRLNRFQLQQIIDGLDLKRENDLENGQEFDLDMTETLKTEIMNIGDNLDY